MAEGHEGWDEYAPFYDWENARTLGRRDVPFWRSLAVQAGGPVLELGCGTGRISLPLARAGVPLVGIDRSEAMLHRARTRIRRTRFGDRLRLIRGDIRSLPFPGGPAASADAAAVRRSAVRRRPARPGGPHVADRPAEGSSASASSGGDASPFAMVMAPYGLLQSLLRERDLAATLGEVHRVLAPGGTFGLELVADLPSWREYRKHVSLKGWRGRQGGAHLTLVETVRQDPAHHLTIFDQEFTERRHGRRRVHRFSLTFRTLSVPQMARRLERAGFEVTALLGDYRGGPWDPRADVWVILAKRP